MAWILETPGYCVTEHGFIHFTAEGLAAYGDRFARCGYLLDHIMLYDEFLAVEAEVLAQESGQGDGCHRGWRRGRLTAAEKDYWKRTLRGEATGGAVDTGRVIHAAFGKPRKG